jgi:hypothetical protein
LREPAGTVLLIAKMAVADSMAKSENFVHERLGGEKNIMRYE